jgi:hypothetical protein
MTTALDQGQYQSVLTQAEPYLATNDPRFLEFRTQANAELDRIAKAEAQARREAERLATIKRLVEQLKTIPASEYQRNQVLYARLVNMNPDNEGFQEKLEHYTAKVQEQKRRELKAKVKREKAHKERVVNFGEMPTQSSWDGSYLAITRYLKRIANDPDSIDIISCTKVNSHADGWLVGCNYRGRNGFGGLIRQSNWFTIRHGSVIQMDDAGAFRSR